jgi:hypothetical protein
MPLYDPRVRVAAPPAERVAIARRFVLQCLDWANEREIPKHMQRVAAEPKAEDASKLKDWLTFRDFLQHALEELEDGRLDGWFEEG